MQVLDADEVAHALIVVRVQLQNALVDGECLGPLALLREGEREIAESPEVWAVLEDRPRHLGPITLDALLPAIDGRAKVLLGVLQLARVEARDAKVVAHRGAGDLGEARREAA